ncbi:3-phosphoshikimate 1-carboxyvinyltransferase [Galactobacillus timonensis]|uniref:3-phosphoshikimate 1-carboxyvinyltransferase n=1 Tax=Bacillota TaxID=1239 RepID=UPI0024097169|nr:3-phosphoshikimate 1-carboxyvinyltransferase [Galactobacillus timonensis]MCI7150673.1 3-phosphoshikimate 1-carboxyvinyltransferase [bacterium]MDD6369529.1 3-phosphoshikimate 1-carboxyvinyltransferase [Galactobacillus timonensis]MDY2887014.1 3-phosphoshikimate 1-carboxyvinyltransferase [Bariatricus sp.]
MEIHTSHGLHGEIEIPGDKSISHRSVMFGALAKGTTEITHFLQGADCLSTIGCFRAMGIEIENTPEKILVHGRGLHGLTAPAGTLDVGNSGTTTRLISGILSGQPFATTLSGDASLNSRPMKRIMEPLSLMGADIQSQNGNGCAPLQINHHLNPGSHPELKHIHYRSRVASAQVKSAVLLAGLYADGVTEVTEPTLSRNHTELMLNGFGANVITINHDDGSATASIQPCEELFARQIQVPGDISSAAYFIAAGLLVPNSELLIRNVGINPTRAGLLEVCRAMGADITYVNQTSASGEPTADLLVRSSSLHGTTVEGAIIPTLIDEIPMIAVMAAFAEGTTVIKDAAELKVKETDRIKTTTEALLAMGADVVPTEDGMIIHGGNPLHGTDINSYLDHRIAMAFSIAGLAAAGTTTIQDSRCVDVSYPEFYESLGALNQ